MDRLEGVLFKAEPQWHVREIMSVLVEQDDFGEGRMPLHNDINHIGDLIRIGPDALSIRFREVDKDIWEWLFKALEEAK